MRAWLAKLKMKQKFVREFKERTLTLSTILLLLYVFAVNTITVVAMKIPMDVMSPLGKESCLQMKPGASTDANMANLCSYGLYILIPLAGWIGDAKIGRKSAITISLITGWLGTLLLSISSSIQSLLCGGTIIHVMFIIAKYILSTSSLLLLLISVSFCYANIFNFGVSQLLVAGASSTKIRAFIHWVIWVIFASGNVTFMVTQFQTGNPYAASICVSMVSFVVFCISLCFHFNCHHLFEEVYIDNCYQLLLGVLKYTWKHKYPENRSSLTYWQDELPSRIDFAKSKFGGPYSTENVETVKTFFRILVIVLALIPFLLASDPLVNEILEFVPQYKGGSTELHGYAGNTIWFIGDDIILIVIPALEFVILPLFPKFEYFLINPLRGIGLSMIFILLSICGQFLIDLIGHIHNDEVSCYSVWTKHDASMNISFWFLLIPSILAGIADMLSYVYIFAFLCSQAPSGMSGMLIGIFWFFRGICIQISALIMIVFEHLRLFQTFSSGPLSCTSLLMFLLGGVAGIGLVVYILAAKWYTNRIRNEDLNLRMTVENHFEKRLLQEEQHDVKVNYFSITQDDSVN